LRNAALQSVLQWHLTKNLAGSSRQVSISFRLPDSAPVQPPAAAADPVQAPAAAAGRRVASQPAWVGRTVKGINVVGLSDQPRADLLSQLPVHEGDTLSAESLQNVTRAVKGFDEHLSVGVMSVGSSEATLEIMVLGGARTDTNPTPPSRIRIGGNVQQTKLVLQPRPTYPPEAKLAHIQGVVKLNAIIAKDGTIQNLEVISGEPALVQSALDAVKQWVYQTTLLNGQPVEVMTEIDVNYTLTQ
jgi:TonB family protein